MQSRGICQTDGMLGYFQHVKLTLHYQSLPFWLALMRDLVSKPKIVAPAAGDGSVDNNPGSGSGQVDNEKRKLQSFVNDDICGTMLDVCFQRLLKREKVLPGTSFSLGPLELWSDDFEGKGEFSQYRSRLLELARFVASDKPLIAAIKVSERIATIIKSLLLSPMSAQHANGVREYCKCGFDGSNEYLGGSSETQLALCRIFEGLLQQLLSLKWTEPALVEVLGHYLDALGLFLKYFPEGVGSVINKLFELLTSLPFVVKDPKTSSARYARLQICTSFVRLAKSAEKSLLPHMKGLRLEQELPEACWVRVEP
ncbi:Protein HASTY 1 [Vitis vinifera]|uniref:Protein HASTY 1 n=1 Tax=Vitis vinifera TaxID=29760 RepID=A0A438C3G5_VITVI|nr:Protein HASTY 1 [Vitis vinifera]